MDANLLAQFSAKFDREFAAKYPAFVKWWSSHKHNDPDPKYAVAPRIAYRCAIYYDEYQEAKQFGAT